VLRHAVDQILKSQADNAQRQQQRAGRRTHLRQLDAWLLQIEDMLEDDRHIVPEPLAKEIAAFLRKEAPPLYRELLRTRERDAARFIDLLFDAQEYVRTHPGGRER
jgi:hypothetical protein